MTSEWTIDTLKEHVAALREADQRLADERHASQLRAIETAQIAEAKRIDAALTAQNEKMAGLNQLREVVTTILSTLITRNEYNAGRQQDAQQGATDQSGRRQGWQLVLAVIGGVGGVIALFITAAAFLLR